MRTVTILVIASVLLLVSGISCVTTDFVHIIIENGAMVKIARSEVVVVALEELSALQVTIPSPDAIQNLQLSDGPLGIVKSNESNTLVAVADPTQFNRGDILLSFSFASYQSIHEPEGWSIITRRPITMKEQFLSGLSTHDPVLVGDFDGDGKVNLDDFDEFGKRYGAIHTRPEYDVIYDISSEDVGGYPRNVYSGDWDRFFDTLGDPDGLIGLDDFNFFAFNFGAVHPYLGTWTFEGTLDPIDTVEFGLVEGKGTGTAVVTMANHEFVVEAVADIHVVTEKQGTITIEVDSSDHDVDMNLDFSEGKMLFNVSFTFDETLYAVVLEGILKQDGNAIYAKVEDGTIRLDGSEEVLGTWTAEKQ